MSTSPLPAAQQSTDAAANACSDASVCMMQLLHGPWQSSWIAMQLLLTAVEHSCVDCVEYLWYKMPAAAAIIREDVIQLIQADIQHNRDKHNCAASLCKLPAAWQLDSVVVAQLPPPAGGSGLTA
jgi:hypothetical protein